MTKGRLFFLLALLSLTAGLALAGNPHFIFVTTTVSEDTVTVVGKLAGLGNEPQVHVVLNADAACINPGNQDPEAANKETFTAAGDFPVQSGKADFSLTLTATFQPSCSPPMSVSWSNIVVCAAGLSFPAGSTCVE